MMKTNASRRGSATVVALVALVTVAALAAVVLSVSHRRSGETSAAVQGERAFFLAESGMTHALENLAAGETDDIPATDFGGGSYEVDFDQIDPATGTWSIVATGRSGLQRRAVEVVARASAGGPWHNGIFADNGSGDPLYALELGGSGAQADEVFGDVYSGGNVSVSGDATVDGTIRAQGSIYGASGEEGSIQPIPDLTAMNYEATADIDVLSQFYAEARYRRDAAGGYAWQVPENNPAHIFRVNPSDRSAETSSTAKHDFFLEDPYERVRADPAQNGSDPYQISLAGVGGEPGPSSNQKVFYIDGNLWLHNRKTYSFQFSHGTSAGVQVTFVVKGNIYFSDNLFYEDAVKDGVAFIAMEDPKVADSGNIYWGDPIFGTLRSMDSFMYAQNDFHDVNLDEIGSTVVQLNGNMTAGEKVVIDRDYPAPPPPRRGDDDDEDDDDDDDDEVEYIHTKIIVNFDDRIATGELVMPGIPGAGAGTSTFEVLSWRRSSPGQP